LCGTTSIMSFMINIELKLLKFNPITKLIGIKGGQVCDIFHMYHIPSLHRVKQIFFKYDTLLPLLAPIERLFICGQQILIPRRNRLLDEMFKKLLFVKNKD
ncbi:hypothetical protein ALC60_11509, partial [Trachymyrmex zeteki]